MFSMSFSRRHLVHLTWLLRVFLAKEKIKKSDIIQKLPPFLKRNRIDIPYPELLVSARCTWICRCFFYTGQVTGQDGLSAAGDPTQRLTLKRAQFYCYMFAHILPWVETIYSIGFGSERLFPTIESMAQQLAAQRIKVWRRRRRRRGWKQRFIALHARAIPSRMVDSQTPAKRNPSLQEFELLYILVAALSPARRWCAPASSSQQHILANAKGPKNLPPEKSRAADEAKKNWKTFDCCCCSDCLSFLVGRTPRSAYMCVYGNGPFMFKRFRFKY